MCQDFLSEVVFVLIQERIPGIKGFCRCTAALYIQKINPITIKIILCSPKNILSDIFDQIWGSYTQGIWFVHPRHFDQLFSGDYEHTMINETFMTCKCCRHFLVALLGHKIPTIASFIWPVSNYPS